MNKSNKREDTMLRHLGHEVIVVEEEEADHSDDEEGSASGLGRGRKERICLYQERHDVPVQIPAWRGWSGNLLPRGLDACPTATTHLMTSHNAYLTLHQESPLTYTK